MRNDDSRGYRLLQRAKLPVVTLLAFVILGIMLFFTFNLSFLSPVKKAIKEFSMTDLYYQILQATGDPAVSPLITIVDMTELISRRELAEALETIEACAPKVVGVDMVFEGRKEDAAGDSMIALVAERYTNIIWSVKLHDYVDDTLEYVGETRSFFTESTPVKQGVTNMRRQLYGGVKRVIDQGWLLRGELQPSFPVSVANDYAGREVVSTALKTIDINFSPTHFTVLPAASAALHPELLAGRIVLFGAMTEEVDMHYTPLGKMPGIVLLAYSIQTLLKQNQVTEVRGIMFWGITYMLVLLTYWLRTRRKALTARCHNVGVRLLLGLPIVGSFISFLWMSLLLWLSLLLFCGYDVSFNLGFAFSAMAFLATAEETFNTI